MGDLGLYGIMNFRGANFSSPKITPNVVSSGLWFLGSGSEVFGFEVFKSSV